MNSSIPVVLAFAAGIALTWRIEDMRWDKDVSSLKESHALTLKNISDKAVIDLAAANRRIAEAQTAAAELDKKFTEGLAHAIEQNDALRADVTAGTRRVRIASANLATCQLTAGQHSGTGCVGNAAQVELSDAGGRAVLDLRASAIKDGK